MPNQPLPHPHPEPPENFDSLSLPISRIDNVIAYRLNPAGYDSAIYYDRSSRGRFENSDLGVLYLGETIEAAFIETFGRRLGVRYISREFTRTRNLFSVESNRPLRLVDMFGSGLVKLGADSEVTSSRDYQLSRNWSRAIYHHPERIDGIRYLSRHDNTQQSLGFIRAR